MKPIVTAEEGTPKPDKAPAVDTVVELVSSLLRHALSGPRDVTSAVTSNEPWLTTAEGARHAAVSEDTLREWVAAGLLPAGRCGRVLRVRRSDIDGLLLSARGAPSSSDAPEDPKVRAREIVEGLREQGRAADGRRPLRKSLVDNT